MCSWYTWIVDVGQFGSLLPRLPLSLQLFQHTYFLCSSTSVTKLSWCSLPVTCLAVSLSISISYPPYLLLSLPIPSSYTLYMHACAFAEQLFCHHATWDLVKVTSRELWTSGCCLVPTHVYLDFGAKSLRLNWMPRHFALPVAVNSGIVTRLNTSHLYLHWFNCLAGIININPH